MRDVVRVQPGHRVPDAAKLLIAAPGVPLGERGPLAVIVGEHGGVRSDSHQGAQPGRGHARLLGRVGKQGAALHRTVERKRRGPRHLTLHPDQAVQLVEGPGSLLVPVEHDRVQFAAFSRGHRVVPRSRRIGARLANPPDRGHRQVPVVPGPPDAPGGQRRADLPGRWTLRRRPGAVPDGRADGIAAKQRNQDREHAYVRRGRRRELDDNVHADRHDQRVAPARPPGQPDHRDEGDEADQIGVEGIDVTGASARHDDRVVEPGGGGALEQDVGDLGRGAGQHAGRECLDETADLAPDELGGGEGKRQDQQAEARDLRDIVRQGIGQSPARPDDVGLRPRRGGARGDRGHDGRDDDNAGNDAAQRVGRLPDSALQLIADLDQRGLQHGMIVSPAPCAGWLCERRHSRTQVFHVNPRETARVTADPGRFAFAARAGWT